MFDARELLGRRVGFRRALMNWYRREARELSWRGASDPYVIWVSEIVLQQTRVDQGTPYIERFLRAFPTVASLADATLDEVLKLWEGLGYYTRARNLHRAAGIVARDRGGVFPGTAAEWEELPGVGRYTAGAIASIAFGEAAPVVDGNVKRVLARLTNLHASIDDGAVVAELWSLAGELVRGKDPGDFNQGIMELGAEVCRPKNPRCEACPVWKYCAAISKGTQGALPVRRPKKRTPHYEIAATTIS